MWARLLSVGRRKAPRWCDGEIPFEDRKPWRISPRWKYYPGTKQTWNTVQVRVALVKTGQFFPLISVSQLILENRKLELNMENHKGILRTKERTFWYIDDICWRSAKGILVGKRCSKYERVLDSWKNGNSLRIPIFFFMSQLSCAQNLRTQVPKLDYQMACKQTLSRVPNLDWSGFHILLPILTSILRVGLSNLVRDSEGHGKLYIYIHWIVDFLMTSRVLKTDSWYFAVSHEKIPTQRFFFHYPVGSPHQLWKSDELGQAWNVQVHFTQSNFSSFPNQADSSKISLWTPAINLVMHAMPLEIIKEMYCMIYIALKQPLIHRKKKWKLPCWPFSDDFRR